jgi:ubiquinone/menaquinone biosynthesis C-methylase UbiE
MGSSRNNTIAGSGGQVLAVDLAESLLQLGRQKAQQQGLDNIEFRAGDFETLGFPDGSFDAIATLPPASTVRA